MLRAVKNRFGSTNEIGVFEMGESGLAEVTNPSGFFLSERPRGAPGSVIVSSLEGTRPLLLELQALVAPANFGSPRRTVIGADYNRVCLLLAVLEKRVGLPLMTQDAFINVAGARGDRARRRSRRGHRGRLQLSRPAGSRRRGGDRRGRLDREVRAVAGLPARLREAAALGFTAAVVPGNNLATRESPAAGGPGVGSVEEAVKALLGG